MSRILGVDLGERYIGLALSDPLRITAQGLETLTRRGLPEDLGRLRDLIDCHQVEEIVVGLPRNMNGTYGPQAEKAREFIQLLGRELDLPVSEWDERLTTRAADRVLLEADVSRKKRKTVVNQMAAQLILQGYLDRIGRERSR